MSRQVKVHCHQGVSGLVESRKNRKTGTIISVYHNGQSGLEDDETAGKYSTVCEDHGMVVCHSTLSLARSHAAYPEWCEVCQEMMFPSSNSKS